jgi:hypothetical protein
MKSFQEALALFVIGIILLASIADSSIQPAGIADNIVSYAASFLGISLDQIQDNLEGDDIE